MVVANEAGRYTAEEYLELERAAEFRNELIHGEIYAMTGVTRQHNRIEMNLIALLMTDLRGGPCEVFGDSMRVKISDTGAYVYPDVTVACGDIQFEDAELDTLLTPTLIIEVLSPSTEAFDRGAKFGHYRQLPTLQEYVLIAQDRVSVERYRRQGEDWLLTAATDIGDTIRLESIRLDLALAEVYERVEFGGAE